MLLLNGRRILGLRILKFTRRLLLLNRLSLVMLTVPVLLGCVKMRIVLVLRCLMRLVRTCMTRVSLLMFRVL